MKSSHDPPWLFLKVLSLWRVISACVLMGCLSACLGEGKVPLRKIHIIADEQANQHTPTRIHMLVVYDVHLLQELKKIGSQDYFQHHASIAEDYKKRLQLIAWDVAPGEVLKSQAVHLRSPTAKGAIIFVRMRSPGIHRLVVDSLEEVTLHIHRHHVEMSKGFES